MGVDVGDRRVKLVSAVFGAVLMTALTDLVGRGLQEGAVDLDEVLAVFEATYSEFEQECPRCSATGVIRCPYPPRAGPLECDYLL